MEWRVPTVANVLEARRRISPHPRPRLAAVLLRASREQLLDALGHRPPPPLEAPRETFGELVGNSEGGMRRAQRAVM